MNVTIRQEAGYDLALYGMSLSFKDRAIKPEDWWPLACEKCATWVDNLVYSGDYSCDSCSQYVKDTHGRRERIAKTATANAGRGKGHDKFLRQIMLWLDIEMPRMWWPEMDQYKIATVTSSESTVHTLLKRPIISDDCELGTRQESIDAYNNGVPYSDLHTAKMNLPEGYLQRRLLTCNYETLRNIIVQRVGHKVKCWDYFVDQIYQQCEHPELLPKR